MKRHAKSLLLLALCCLPRLVTAQSAVPSSTASHTNFDTAATAALQSMRAQAETLKTTGVAVLAYCEGDTIQSWTSRMAVVGRLRDEPTATNKGSNLLAIAYAKAAEMADTLKDSGSQIRPPMTGEFGWQGGAILRVQGGYLIAAFSGGKSEDDLAISRAGLAMLQQQMKLAPH